MIIDVHTHIVPESFPNRPNPLWPSMDPSGPGRANVVYAGKNYRTVTSGCWDVGTRVAEMAPQGVDRHVLSPMPRLIDYDMDVDDALAMARYLNEVTVRMVEDAPESFYGLGTVPLQHPAEATKELARVKELGLRGIEIQTNVNGKNIGAPEFRDFLREVEALGLCIFSHAQNPTFSQRLMVPAAENSVGFPVENTLAASGVLIGRVLEDCPDLRICFSHGGGGFTMLLPRLENQWKGGGPLRDLLPQSPTGYARKLYYDDVLFSTSAVRYLIDTVGVSQVVLGSDYPFMRRDLTPEQEFQELKLSQADREAVAYKNALRFLGLTEG